MNNMMYPDCQSLYFFRSVFWKKQNFVSREEITGKEVRPGEGRRRAVWLLTAAALVGAITKRDWVMDELPRRLRFVDIRALLGRVLVERS
jgi:hypothetical protein